MLNTIPQFQVNDSQHSPHTGLRDSSDRQSCLVRIYPAGVSGSLIPLTFRRITIGRDPSCTLEINDDFLSRTHAILELTDHGYQLTDCNSCNGTFVNDRRITTQVLKAGDQIRVGNHIFKFLSSDHVETHYHEAVYEMMTVDAMTGVYNRRYFEDAFRREVLRSQRHGRPLSLLIFDIDKFKQINDNYGQPAGDAVLREMSKQLKEIGDEAIMVARYGGEEFGVIFEGDTTSAAKVMEKLRIAVAGKSIDAEGHNINISISSGVARILKDERIGKLVRRSDEALYSAKMGGRNRVFIHNGMLCELFGKPSPALNIAESDDALLAETPPTSNELEHRVLSRLDRLISQEANRND